MARKIPQPMKEVKTLYVCKNCKQKQDDNRECVKCNGRDFSTEHFNYMPAGDKHKYRILKNVIFRGETVRAGSVLEILDDELKHATPGIFERVHDNAKEVMVDEPVRVVKEMVELEDGTMVEASMREGSLAGQQGRK